MKLEDIQGPEFLKTLNKKETKELSMEIRQYIIKAVAKNGGHFSSNLGAIEATIAIHQVFDSPRDKILFDVGHQSYTHKILTGRAQGLMDNFRQYGGIAGYQKPSESIHDPISAGHSSTAISVAQGLAVARDLNNDDHHVIAFIGDGAIASGLSFEALNNLSALKSKIIIVLNDNEMSITNPVGGLGKMMSKFRNSAGYNKSKHTINKFFGKVPILGVFLKRTKNAIKSLFLESNIFEQMNIRYIGVIDGHDINDVSRALKLAKSSKNSVLIHLSTQKGHGYPLAANDITGAWHGVEPFDVYTGKRLYPLAANLKSWSYIMSSLIGKMANECLDLVFITPAMVNGSKMEELQKNFPDRFFDVGIAEEHAVTFASGLALGGKIPYLSVYSTFMQRAYDNLNHDIARMNLPFIVTVDRAGLVGEDGDTHHGYFDVEICKGLPNSFIAMPLDYLDAKYLLEIALKKRQLSFVRVPRGSIDKNNNMSLPPFGYGEWSYLHRGHGETVVITTGPISNQVNRMIEKDFPKIDVVFARFYRPIDCNLLSKMSRKLKNIIVYDIYATKNALYSDICTYMCEQGRMVNIVPMTLPNEPVTHGKIDELLVVLKLSINDLFEKIKELK